ncbi:MAG: hypothetical protein J3R72DRAFT_158496 [Linnemannia gamsii]|nr:MAG: hypothetical protein J3R72DRAFT_158496 [Linnemannia gamsii]
MTHKNTPQCTDFNNCSLPKNKQTREHLLTYHDPRPKMLHNLDPTLPPIMVYRDPNQGMYFPCPHPECDHISILRNGPYQHQKHCRFQRHDRQTGAIVTTKTKNTTNTTTATSTAAAVSVIKPLRPVRIKRQRRRQSLVSRRQVDLSLSSALPAAPRSSSSGSNLNHTSLSDPPAATTAASDADTTEILTGMRQLVDIVAGLGKQLDRQTKIIDIMSEQMDILTDQIEKLRNRNASVEARTGSISLDMGLVADH